MGSRRFGEEIPELEKEREKDFGSREEVADLVEWMRTDEIGHDAMMTGPFGEKKIVYCDYTASARAFSSIESYLQNEVLPFYGNTHSSVTITAEQTTLFMHEARQEIRAMTGAGDLDDVIFTGSGSTCAVELLAHLMQIETEIKDMIVVHSTHEHHSNLLPWRHKAKECIRIDEDDSGRVDLDHLQKTLSELRGSYKNAMIIGAFSACSNITGCLVNVQKVTAILKKYDVISIWDYASAAPYVSINVNGHTPIDALFFSGHKFPGAVGSPGVLIVKKAIIKAKKPKRIGGGTVFFVNESDEWYLKEAEHREEGGTADAVGAVRMAMATKLKRQIGEKNIEKFERDLTETVLRKLESIPNFVLLGPPTRRNRLSVFSFLIKNPSTGLFFHHNYISALLNDLFGIQTRAGCMCAGPYAQKLLGIDEELSLRFVNALQESSQLDRTHLRRHAEYSQREFLRPGFTRISFPYFFSIEKVEAIVDCIRFVAEHADDFIHLYQVNCESGEWHHKNQRVFHGRRWLGHSKFTKNGLVWKKENNGKVSIEKSLKEILIEAEEIAKRNAQNIDILKIPDGRLAIDSKYSDLRWFVLPIEVAEVRAGRNLTGNQQCVFKPFKYSRAENEDDDILEENINGVSITPVVDVAEACKDEDNFVCPLNPEEVQRPRGINGEIGDEKEAEEVRKTEDWNKRVIVKREELSKEQEARLNWHQPPLDIYKKMTDVIHQLKMIREGDKVLVCLSGGKDSLALLHFLNFYQQRCRKARSISFELGAITIDPGSAEYNPRPLIEYCKSLNIDYFYEEQDIIGAAKKVPGLRSICAFCSRMKRGRLAAAAQLHGWNVLAMGQHLDDLVESFFIAAFQNGNLSTMKAQYKTKDGTLRVIRPLVFIREKSLRHFSEEKKLPVVAENCPACFNQATERHRIKQLLAQQELVFPDLFNSLRSALRPLLLVDSAHTSEMRTQGIDNIVKTLRAGNTGEI